MTAFSTEKWSETLLANLRKAAGGFSGRIVNHNFHNAGGTKADSVKIMTPSLAVVGTASNNALTMPTFSNAASTTTTLNLDTPIRYAVGLPYDVMLKTTHDVLEGYRMAAEDVCIDIRNNQVLAKLNAANIPVVSGTAAAPTKVTKDSILQLLDDMYVQLMKVGAITEYGTYRFIDTEGFGESIAELGGEQQALEIDGQEAPGVIKSQVKTALPALGVPSKIYSLIRSAATEAGELTQEKEFYGHVPVIRGFEIVLDENLDNSDEDSNPHMLIYAGTRNLVTEAMTAAITEEIPDADAYRKILRGYIVYGCAVTNANCGAKAFVKV